MDVREIVRMSDEELLELASSVRPDEEAISLLATALVDDTWFECISELRRRYTARVEQAMVRETERHPSATSVHIDSERWRNFWFRRRINLIDVGPMISRSTGWANVCAYKGRANYYVLDELASELGIMTDDLVFEVGTDLERERVGLVR